MKIVVIVLGAILFAVLAWGVVQSTVGSVEDGKAIVRAAAAQVNQ
ncbi:hypothetical protein AAHK20_25470 [Trinickia sp. YCB016]